MNPDRCIALGALAVSIVSILWQFFTWRQKRRIDETPKLKVFFKINDVHLSTGHIMKSSVFVIKNIGTCGVTILDCEINGKPITAFEELGDSEQIIGAILQPDHSIQCSRFPGINTCNQVTIGSVVKVTYKADSGKTLHKIFTLSEDAE